MSDATRAPSTETDMSAARAVVATLARNGLKHLFALPGVQNDHLFDALHAAADEFRIIHTRHEQGAAYMALGAALATGKPAGYCVVPGPGVLNTTAALCTAYACNAPVLCLTGQIPGATIGRGFGMLHELPDQLGLMRSLTKWADRIDAPDQAASKTTEAFRQLLSGRPRPVSLECPIDIWPRRSNAPLEDPAMAAAPPEIDAEAIEGAARLLGDARTPLILIGGGAINAGAELRILSEMLQAPVVSHRMGRGILDDRSPLSVHAEIGHRLWPKADVVVGIGTRLQTPLMAWGDDSDLRVIHIDIDAQEIGRVRKPDIGIHADATQALKALIDALARHNRRRPSRVAEIDALRAASSARLSVLAPQKAYLDVIRAELPDEGIFVDEVTQLGHAARLIFPVYRPRTFLTPGYQGTLGWGLATAIGAAAARPDLPVVAISGDGGFMFTVQELATAVQHKIPLVVVLMNDNAFGNVRRTRIEDFGNRTICSDLVNSDFMKLTESFGAAAYRVQSPNQLRVQLRASISRRELAIIEVRVGPMPSPWSILRFKRVRPG